MRSVKQHKNISRFVDGEMTPGEQASFRNSMASDDLLKHRTQIERSMIDSMKKDRGAIPMQGPEAKARAMAAIARIAPASEVVPQERGSASSSSTRWRRAVPLLMGLMVVGATVLGIRYGMSGDGSSAPATGQVAQPAAAVSVAPATTSHSPQQPSTSAPTGVSLSDGSSGPVRGQSIAEPTTSSAASGTSAANVSGKREPATALKKKATTPPSSNGDNVTDQIGTDQQTTAATLKRDVPFVMNESAQTTVKMEPEKP